MARNWSVWLSSSFWVPSVWVATKLRHGVGQAVGQLVLEDGDAVGRRREVARHDAVLQPLDKRAHLPLLHSRPTTSFQSKTRRHDPCVNHQPLTIEISEPSPERLRSHDDATFQCLLTTTNRTSIRPLQPLVDLNRLGTRNIARICCESPGQ